MYYFLHSVYGWHIQLISVTYKDHASNQHDSKTNQKSFVLARWSKVGTNVESLMTEDSFHISVSSSPPPEDMNSPTNKEVK